MKKKLLGLSPAALEDVVTGYGLPRFTAKQIALWLYKKKVSSISQMTNLSLPAREAISRDWEVGICEPSERLVSADGTVKYLFPVDGFAVEAVMIPDEERATLCVSSQKGCRMGCKFCMTGRQGWHGNLDAAQILSQFIAISESDRLTNAVFMGMGEPLDNYDTLSQILECLTAEWGFGWSPKRITVSSIGVLPNLERLLEEQRCHIAISLHNPIPEERMSLMPVEKAYPITKVIDLLKEYDFSGQRRVSFEYTMFGGFNDDKRHCNALVRLLKGLECRVNLIRFHRIPDFPYVTATDSVMNSFRDRLNGNGVTTTVRASRGEDIFAACGLLAGRKNNT